MTEPQPAFAIALHEDDGTLLVGIHPDGQIETGPNYQPDAAASEFWDAVTRAAQAANPWGGPVTTEPEGHPQHATQPEAAPGLPRVVRDLTLASERYPRQDGDFTILGPEIFTDQTGDVICWKGVNYVRQEAKEATE